MNNSKKENSINVAESNFIKCHRHVTLCNNMKTYCSDTKYSSNILENKKPKV